MARKKKQHRESTDSDENLSGRDVPALWRTREFAIAIVSGVLLCGAFPPLGIWPLAFVAPIGWLRLIRTKTLPEKRPFGTFYLAGFVHWMILVQWVRLPHWSAYFGWIVLAGYLAVYIPAFVFISRAMVHRWRVPSVLAAAVAWTGLELARGYLFTGFSLSLLGHAVVNVPLLTQIADTFGAYGVSFVVMTVAAGIERCIPLRRGDERPLQHSRIAAVGSSVWAGCLLLVTLLYGWTQLQHVDAISAMPAAGNPEVLNIGLIQGVYDTEFDTNQEVARRRSDQAFDDYVRISREAMVEDLVKADLIIWPESMFSTGWRHGAYFTYDDDLTARPDLELTKDEWKRWLVRSRHVSDASFAHVANMLRMDLYSAEMIVGVSRVHASGDTEQRFNSAMHVDSEGKLIGWYDKMHPVMFGEYVPLGSLFPWLYKLTPMGAGLTAGAAPEVFNAKGIRICPSICFENTVPHLIRQQLDTLAENGEEPDCLVTITNDGWFWGSSLLDVHLACGVFRAIENRKPMLIAANTGFSAHIDRRGDIVSKGPRRAEGHIWCGVSGRNAMISNYRRLGDWPAGCCLALSLTAWLMASFPHRSPG